MNERQRLEPEAQSLTARFINKENRARHHETYLSVAELIQAAEGIPENRIALNPKQQRGMNKKEPVNQEQTDRLWLKKAKNSTLTDEPHPNQSLAELMDQRRQANVTTRRTLQNRRSCFFNKADD